VLLHGLEPALRVELGEDDQRAAAPDGGEGRRRAGDVVERHGEKRGVVGLRVRGLHRVRHVDGHAQVGEHDALGHRRGAARVDDDRRVRVLDLDEHLVRLVRRDELIVRRHALRLRVVADVVLHRLEVAADGGGEVKVALPDEQQLAAGVVHHVGELFLLRAIVERHEHRPHLGAGEVRLHVLH
jgi:hypothetical protein